MNTCPGPNPARPALPEGQREEGAPPPGASSPHLWRSEDVLRGQRAVEILHAGLRYRLSVTSSGKLILTK